MVEELSFEFGIPVELILRLSDEMPWAYDVVFRASALREYLLFVCANREGQNHA